MKSKLIIASLFIAILTSCSHSSNDEVDLSDGIPTIYMPLKINNFWKYDVSSTYNGNIMPSKDSLYVSNDTIINSITNKKMKSNLHPENYRMVAFKDMSNEYSFLCPSCTQTKDTVVWEDGNEYPLVKLDISYKSHPFFTGVQQFVDTAGRIDKFMKRYNKK